MSITQVNRNVLNNIDFFIEFFDMRLYNEQLSGDFSMFLWLSFLQNTPKFTVPLLSIDSIQKNNTLWFANQFYDDIAVVNVDNSEQYNLMNFITKGITPKDVDLKALMYLGASLKFRYIDQNGTQQEEYLFTGRVSLNTFNNEVLKLNITSFGSILKGSDFESKVMKYPTGSSYNFISLFQAFCNIINVPRNIIDDQSYAICPFILNQSTYVPAGTQGIIITEDIDPDLYELYAEDTVANTSEYIHTQFYYSKLDPSCYIRITKYDDDGNILEVEESSTLQWNVWGNTVDMLNSGVGGYFRDIVTNYQRYFRPFRVAIAGENERTMFLQGNYRIHRNLNFGKVPSTEYREDYYDPQVENSFWAQAEVNSGKYACIPGDKLVYFEVLGDVRIRSNIQNQESANILYDNYSTVYVYNLDRNIVYFDHISNFVQTVPMPSQWLKMKDYIGTEQIFFSSSLDYESLDNLYSYFMSQIKPMCGLPSSNGLRYSVASTRSLKENQDAYGSGGNFVGEKMVSLLGFFVNDTDISEDVNLANFLDNIKLYNKPKTIKLSDDGEKIYYLKNTSSGFAEWYPTWESDIVNSYEYNIVSQVPKIFKYCFKYLYIEKMNGSIGVNEKEYDSFNYITYGDESSFPVINEISDRFNSNSLVLADFPIYDILYNRTGGIIKMLKSSNNSLIESTRQTVITTLPVQSVSIFFSDDVFYWCYANVIYSNFTVYKTFDATWQIVDYNHTLKRAIIQTQTQLYYYDTLNDEVLFQKAVFGIEYLYSMNRERFLFSSTLLASLGETYNIGSVTNEPVRLLSYSGNRLTGMMSLANTFLKNMNYDNFGRLKIGYTENYNNIILTDKDIISIDAETMKYDIIEWDVYTPTKTSYTDTDNDNNTNLEEDEDTFDSKISVSMYSTKDVQLNFRISRISTTEIKWEANNQFGSLDDTITISGGIFDFFSIDLNGIFTGINIKINFFGRELLQGESFAGTINKRELANTKEINKIENETKDLPFLDNTKLSLDPKFLYKKHAENYKSEIENTFVSGTRIREMVIYNVQVPTLLILDINYKILNIGDKARLLSEIVDTDGWKECFIEQITYDIENKITNLKLITFV